MKVYGIQSKNKCKELDDWSSYKDDYMENPGTCVCERNKASKIDTYLDNKNWWISHPSGKLVLACQYEILNTSENSLDDQKVT